METAIVYLGRSVAKELEYERQGEPARNQNCKCPIQTSCPLIVGNILRAVHGTAYSYTQHL